MSSTICIAPSGAIGYRATGGGHLWAYLNWALGLRALGYRVLWYEYLSSSERQDVLQAVPEGLEFLARYGITPVVDGDGVPPALAALCPDVDAAAESDLLLNFRYALEDPTVVSRFRRSALVDIDPGLLQMWMAAGLLDVARHDHYFTIGESIGQPGSRCPDAGVSWHYTPPPVFLDEWPTVAAADGAPYTTVANWWGGWEKWGDDLFPNDKRTAFLEFADLPLRTRVALELALNLGDRDCDDRRLLESKGFRVVDPVALCATPDDYRGYVQRSRGEWSCAKPSCMKLGAAWISDRTLCYLASGKPAVVQHTGRSRFLPDACGLWRFRDLDGAARSLEAVEGDYDRQCREARSLAETYFDARVVVGKVLEVALG